MRLFMNIAITVVATAVLGCRPSEVGSEARDGSETSDSTETSDVDACEAWSGEFVVRDQAAILSDESRCGGAAVLPTAEPEVVVFATPDINNVTGVAVRFAIAPDGTSQLLETTDPIPELPQDVFAFDDLLIAGHRRDVASGDTVSPGYGASLWRTDGPLALERVFPEFPTSRLLPIAAATTSPGVIDVFFAVDGVPQWIEHWRHEAGVLDEVGQHAVPSGVTALLLDDLDHDDFVDLLVATDAGLYVSWADDAGVPTDQFHLPGVLATELSGAVALAAGNIDFHHDREFLAVWRDSDGNGVIRVFDQLGSWCCNFSATMKEETGLMLGPVSGQLFLGFGRPRALLEDLDGDGYDDLLYVDAPSLGDGVYGDHRVVARTSCGDGTFGPSRLLFSHDGRIADVSVVDFSHDGRPDLIVFADAESGATMITLEQQ